MNMDVKTAYDNWSSQYDSNENKTRDLEAIALRECLKDISFETCLEIGCGTGKNSQWLITKANHITAVDLSTEMLAKAKEKIQSDKIEFVQADITKVWNFQKKYDLVSFSLVLEHIENLDSIFEKTANVLKNGGHVYVGELHPFKQYGGSKARYQTEDGEHVVECYTHNISDFIEAAKKHGLEMVDLKEYFDDDERTNIPRFLFGRSLQLIGPLDGAGLPAEAVTVYAIVHRRDRATYEFDADALAAGLASRLDGWYRGEAGDEWSRPDPDRHLVLYAPRALSAGEALALLPPGLLVEDLYEDGYALCSSDLVVRVSTAESSLVTFPLIARQPWFTGWEHTTEYRVEPRHAAAHAEAMSAALLIASECGALKLDQHGFPWS